MKQRILKLLAREYRKYRRGQSERRAGFTPVSTMDAYRMENLLTYDAKKHYCERKAFAQMGYFPNLDHPSTYSEKIIWLALHYKNPLIARCADKYEMKAFVRERLGEDCSVPTIGVYESVNDIPFDALPDRVVFKSTAGWSAKQVILFQRGKTGNLDRIKSKMAAWLYPWNAYYYNNLCITDEKIVPRIIVEEMIGNGRWITDYKVYCFNGQPQMLLIVTDRGNQERRTFVRLSDWTVLPIKRKSARIDPDVKRPEALERMVEAAKKLSEGVPFVRIDFYLENGRMYVGEMTFTPGLFLTVSPPEWDQKLGNLLDLHNIMNEGKREGTNE